MWQTTMPSVRSQCRVASTFAPAGPTLLQSRWYAKPTVKARFSTTKELQNQYGKENKKS